MTNFHCVQLLQAILMHTSRWWKNNITNLTGAEIDILTSSAGYAQIIDKPTHILNNSMSCIDLIFCTNKNIISNHGVCFDF